MELYSGNKDYKLYHGNCLDIGKVVADNSIDSIVTDPPYELDFMSKSWDRSGIAFRKETWEKFYNVLKPGGYLLAFGGSRTFHRIACAIEDAGFEIRDTIMWLYGSGFPKSMDIGKAVESKLVTGSANTQEWKNLEGTKVKTGDWGVNENCFRYGARPSDYSADGHMRTEKVDYKTEEGKKWDGWGTALKPSYEPVIVARKPCEGTCIDNVLKYGVGGMNIDECRVGDTERTEVTVSGRFPSNTILTYDDSDYDEVCGGMPVGGKNGSITKDYRDCRGDIVYGRYSDTVRHWDAYADSGSASRYFYCAKASVTDREEGLESLKDGIFRRVRADKSDDNPTGLNKEGRFAPVSRKNIHPTVKPTSLMQYLIRLVTPKGGIVLDPFNGSGSTGKAVMVENRERNADYQYIGIELTDEYLPIAKGRIEYILGVETLPNEIHEPDITAVPKTTQLSLWDCI